MLPTTRSIPGTYADAYKQQDLVNTTAIGIFNQQIDLAATIRMEPSAADMNLAEIQSFLRDDAVVHGRPNSLVQLLQKLEKQYADILKA